MLYSHVAMPREPGHPPALQPTLWPFLFRGMILVDLQSTCMHIHHWMVYLYILLLLPNPWNFLGGWSGYMYIQGLLYPDAFHILQANPWPDL